MSSKGFTLIYLGYSVLSMVVPVYNAELAPKSLRGRLVSLNQLAITAGIMVKKVSPFSGLSKTIPDIIMRIPMLLFMLFFPVG